MSISARLLTSFSTGQVTFCLVVFSLSCLVTWRSRHGACPADIWCENDVVLTLMRRDYLASTLIRRHLAPNARWVGLRYAVSVGRIVRFGAKLKIALTTVRSRDWESLAYTIYLICFTLCFLVKNYKFPFHKCFPIMYKSAKL